MARPIGPEPDVEEELEELARGLEIVPKEHEKRESNAMDKLNEQPLKSVEIPNAVPGKEDLMQQLGSIQIRTAEPEREEEKRRGKVSVKTWQETTRFSSSYVIGNWTFEVITDLFLRLRVPNVARYRLRDTPMKITSVNYFDTQILSSVYGAFYYVI